MAIKLDAKAVHLARKRLDYKKHPIKFIEENIYLPLAGGNVLMKLYDPQKKLVMDFFNHHNLILLKSRQIGMSTLCQALIAYLFTFHENCVVGILSRDGNESSDFCYKTQNMIDELPDDLRPIYNNKARQFFTLTNGCQLHTEAVSYANPGKVFRSKSITLLIVDEAAHVQKIDEAWTGIGSTLSKAQPDAEKAGVPYGTIVLSTPNKTEGIGKWFYSMWIGAIRGDNAFRPHKIHWKEIPSFTEDPNWYSHQCKMLNNNKNKIAQELDLKFVGAEGALFPEDVQIRLQDNSIDPDEVMELPIRAKSRKAALWRFKKINRGHFHLIGVDAATEAGDDKSAIEVIDYETMEQIMEFHGDVDPKELADIVRLVCAHCPHNTVIVENQGGYGQAVLYELSYDEEVEYNLYGTYKGSNNKNKNNKNSIFVPGLSTNAKTRPLILDSLYDYIVHDPDLIYSQRLSSELLGLVNKGNRVEADKGFHDDLAMAYGFCCYIRKYQTEYLGEIQGLPDDEAQLVFTADTLKIMRGLNGDAPFIGDRKIAMETGQEDPDFRQNLNKYIHEKVMSGEMCGIVDVNALMGQPF